MPPVAPTPAAPVAPIQIDTTTLSPEAKRFLDMFNGDIATALSKGLEYNNRLGKNGEAGQPATPQDPHDPTAPPDGPMQVTAQEFNQAVVTFTRTDPQCRQLDNKYLPIVRELEGPDPANGQTGLDAHVEQLRQDVEFQRRYAELPAIKQDEYQAREALESLRAMRAELTTAESRQWLLHQQRADLQRQWLARRDAYANHLEGQIAERQESYRQAQASAQAQAVAETSLRSAWKPALDAAMAQNQIPAELYEHFDRTCRMTALANLEAGMLVEDAATFALEQAAEYAKMLDTHHRTKSREYAQSSAHRTGQTTDAGPLSVIPPQEQVPSGDSLEARLLNARRGLRQDYAAAGR